MATFQVRLPGDGLKTHEDFGNLMNILARNTSSGAQQALKKIQQIPLGASVSPEQLEQIIKDNGGELVLT